MITSTKHAFVSVLLAFAFIWAGAVGAVIGNRHSGDRVLLWGSTIGWFVAWAFAFVLLFRAMLFALPK